MYMYLAHTEILLAILKFSKVQKTTKLYCRQSCHLLSGHNKSNKKLKRRDFKLFAVQIKAVNIIAEWIDTRQGSLKQGVLK